MAGVRVTTTTQTPPVYLDSGWLRNDYGLSEREVVQAWRELPVYRTGGSRKKVRRDEFEAWVEKQKISDEGSAW